MPSISNNYLQVEISAQGAELQSIYNKQTQLDYLWNGNPAFWAKRSPVLFPIVGELKNKTYTYKAQSYELSRHGFARDMLFKVTDHTEESLTFMLAASDKTLKVYPFHFSFSVQYSIDNNRVHVLYKVQNTGSDSMYFSAGGHPAFNVPLTGNTRFEDYYLIFSQAEEAGRYPLTADGLVKAQPVPMLHGIEKLPLQHNLFYDDALVFKHLQSASVTLGSAKTNRGLTLYFQDFPYLGIWSKSDANFLCIEPWCGIADGEHATGNLTEKEGIISLTPDEVFERQWSVEVF